MEFDENNDEDGIKLPIYEIQQKIIPYQKPLLYISLLAFLFIILFVGFGLGAFKVCNSMGGFLDDRLECHLDYYNRTNPLDLIHSTPQNINLTKYDI